MNIEIVPTAETEIITAQVSAYSEKITSLSIESDTDLAYAGEMLKLMRSYIKEIDRIRTELVKPLNNHVKMINSRFKPLTEAAEAADSQLSLKMKAYNDTQRQRREAEARAAQEAEANRLREAAEAAEIASAFEEIPDGQPAKILRTMADTVEAATPKPMQTFRSGSAKSTFSSVWRYEISEPMAIPRVYLEPNDKAIKAAIKDGVRIIAGIRIYEDSIITTR
jgi:hypothetical protein